MRRWRLLSVSIAANLGLCTGPSGGGIEYIAYPALRADLLGMSRAYDEALATPTEQDDTAVAARNAKRLLRIVEQIGYPARLSVGSDGLAAATRITEAAPPPLRAQLTAARAT